MVNNNNNGGLIDFRKHVPGSTPGVSGFQDEPEDLDLPDSTEQVEQDSAVPLPQIPDHEPQDEDLKVSVDMAEGTLGVKLHQIERNSHESAVRQQAIDSGFGYVNLLGVTIDPEALSSVSENEARTSRVICFTLVPHQEIRMATDTVPNSAKQKIEAELSDKYNAPVRWFLITKESLDETLKQYADLPKVRSIERGVEIKPEELDRFSDIKSMDKLQESLHNTNVSERVGLIVAAAIQLNASDVHMESESDALVLRLRIDGILHEVARLGKEQERPIYSRFKLVSGLKINISDRPQDGHFIIRRPKGKVDVRISAVPTNYGESLVMRILRSDVAQHDISGIGMRQRDLEILEREIARPNGLFVVCGPTGSGKTTTLYASLSKVKSSENKILTIEDPIEYELPGINQSQVNGSKGYTFASGLRALVRQDPDIILVGEIRDSETVEIAISAALTGHFVFSTLHTNDAAGALPRFLSMDAKPYLLAPALNTVLAQRLVRVLCEQCKQPTELSEDLKNRTEDVLRVIPESVQAEIPANLVYFTASGCSECNGLGFKGRQGIFEIFTMTPELKDMVLKGELSELTVREQLKKQQMVTMAQDGILKALQGITSVAEVFRVVEER